MSFANDPVRVLEVLLVGRREIAGNREWAFPIPVDRSAKFMLDEIDDDRVESLAPPRFKVRFGLLIGEAGNERPCRITLDQEWRSGPVHQVPMVGRHVQWIPVCAPRHDGAQAHDYSQTSLDHCSSHRNSPATRPCAAESVIADDSAVAWVKPILSRRGRIQSRLKLKVA